MLTGRQRLLRTLRREPVDRFPIDLGAHFSTGISAFAYEQLRRHLGLDTNRIEIVDTMQFLARVDDDVRDRFHIDTALLHAGWPATARWNPRGAHQFTVPAAFHAGAERLADGSWVVRKGRQQARLPDGGFFFDGDWIGWDDLPESERFALLAQEARRLHGRDDPGILLMGGFWGFASEHPDWLMRSAEDPERVCADNERSLTEQLARLGRLIDTLGDLVQVVEINSDLGSQRGPFIGPKSWCRISQPYMKRFCDFVHRNSDWKVFIHSCGSIQPLIPHLIDAGIDILNPVQITAANMDPAVLKQRYGDRLIFWGGGCATQGVLDRGTPVEVRANVRHLAGILGAGGGMVFNQVHNIMGDVPPENVVAMLDEAYAVAIAPALTRAVSGLGA